MKNQELSRAGYSTYLVGELVGTKAWGYTSWCWLSNGIVVGCAERNIVEFKSSWQMTNIWPVQATESHGDRSVITEGVVSRAGNETSGAWLESKKPLQKTVFNNTGGDQWERNNKQERDSVDSWGSSSCELRYCNTTVSRLNPSFALKRSMVRVCVHAHTHAGVHTHVCVCLSKHQIALRDKKKNP